MRIHVVILILVGYVFGNQFPAMADFKQEQRRYVRFRTALAEKDSVMREVFAEKNVTYPPAGVFIRIFKEERAVELWAQSTSTDTFALIKTYNICSLSGKLGPKRQRGDLQIPEGFYHIDRFNPASNFYLSLGINYPNASDRILGVRGRLGGDIFIHGSCVTIGCVPITDNKIKELYLVAVEAKTQGQRQIPVHIFPKKLDDEGLNELQQRFEGNETLLSFWENLKEGFTYFEEIHQLPIIKVSGDGVYLFN